MRSPVPSDELPSAKCFVAKQWVDERLSTVHLAKSGLTKCLARGCFRMSVLFHPHTTMHNEYDNDVHICMH